MTADNKYIPEIRWDQGEFENLRATWSRERIAEDEKVLNAIFAQAAEVPLLAEALAWAEQHGITFFVDRRAKGSNGYYTLGTGVVAVTAGVPVGQLIVTLVHELRHAWQDYHGLAAWPDDTPHEGDFTRVLMNNALMEADAAAFGALAGLQAEIARVEKKQMSGELLWSWEKRILARKPKALAGTPILQKEFLGWFTCERKWHPKAYGDYLSKLFGRKWELYDGELSQRNFEFQPVEPVMAGVNIDDRQDVLRLGVNFSGAKNYLAGLSSEILSKNILRPSLANTFWGAAGKRQRRLATNLRKAYLKQKLAPENRKKHPPWP